MQPDTTKLMPLCLAALLAQGCGSQDASVDASNPSDASTSDASASDAGAPDAGRTPDAGPPPPAPVESLWSRGYGDASAQLVRSIATDADGNVLITGYFQGTMDLGGGPLASGGEDEDIFVAKLDPAGNHLWSRRYGDTSAQLARSIAVDAAGNILITGYFESTVEFGGDPLTSTGNHDIFVAKLDPAGNHLWSRRYGDASPQLARSITVDASGNILVTGHFQGSLSFGGSTLTSAGEEDIFVAKLDSSGNHLWSRRYGDDNAQFVRSIATDAAGNVLITGGFESTVNLGGGTLTSAGDYDIFVAKLSPTGTHLWSRRYGDAEYQYFSSIAVDTENNILIAGAFRGTLNFGDNPLTNAGNDDMFVAKLDPDGTHLWSRGFGDVTYQNASSIAVDTAGNVLVTGRFGGQTEFGGDPLTSAGSVDVFVVKLGPSGEHLWSYGFGDGDVQDGVGIAADAAGNVLVMGYFLGTVDFGNGPIASGGNGDIFLFKLPPTPVPNPNL